MGNLGERFSRRVQFLKIFSNTKQLWIYRCQESAIELREVLFYFTLIPEPMANNLIQAH